MGRTKDKSEHSLRASISMPPQIMRAAQERAERMGLNFSVYLECLIRDDLARGGNLILSAARIPPGIPAVT